jgi:hypothetical protein
MTEEERLERAIEWMRIARTHIDASTVLPDPVMQRRHNATAAACLRKAANLLDDDRRLQEEVP